MQILKLSSGNYLSIWSEWHTWMYICTCTCLFICKVWIIAYLKISYIQILQYISITFAFATNKRRILIIIEYTLTSTPLHPLHLFTQILSLPITLTLSFSFTYPLTHIYIYVRECTHSHPASLPRSLSNNLKIDDLMIFQSSSK